MANAAEIEQFAKERLELWNKNIPKGNSSLESYFDHIGRKPYLPGHFEVGAVAQEELRAGHVVEIGTGVGNDAEYLLTVVGVQPHNLFLYEPDIEVAVDAMDRLEPLMGQYLYRNFTPRGILSNRPHPPAFANIVYMSNTLHCVASFPDLSESWEVQSMSAEDRVKETIGAAYSLLLPGGIFFGRALAANLDWGKLSELQMKSTRTEQEEFVLQTANALAGGQLKGVKPDSFLHGCISSGFKKAWIKPRLTVPVWSPVSDFYFRAEK